MNRESCGEKARHGRATTASGPIEGPSLMQTAERLAHEYDLVRTALEGHPRITLLSAAGDAPDRYLLEFRVRGLSPATSGLPGGQPMPRFQHLAAFLLPPDFPREPPRCRFLTPVFHPNIYENLTSLAHDWDEESSVAMLMLRAADALAFQYYDLNVVLNNEAAAWVRAYASFLPLDTMAPLERVEEEPVSEGDDGAFKLAPAPKLPYQPLPATVRRRRAERDLAAVGPPPGRLIEPETGLVYLVVTPITYIGRGFGNSIVMDSRKVSRMHCLIEHSPMGFRIVDMGSTNGTFVNKRRIDAGSLYHGDRIRVGLTELVFEAEGPSTGLFGPLRQAASA